MPIQLTQFRAKRLCHSILLIAMTGSAEAALPLERGQAVATFFSGPIPDPNNPGKFILNKPDKTKRPLTARLARTGPQQRQEPINRSFRPPAIRRSIGRPPASARFSVSLSTIMRSPTST